MDEARVVKCLPVMHKVLAQSTALQKLDELLQTCSSSTWEVKAVRLEVLGYPWLYINFGSSLATQEAAQKKERKKMAHVSTQSFISLVLSIL